MSNPTAAMLVIGDEILSGRTKDSNTNYLACELTKAGVDLKEARVVSDDRDAIVAAVKALSGAYDHVFTSGGIGPTHDDITAEAVAAAFDVPLDLDPRAVAIMEKHYPQGQFTPARQRMARIPEGADLIENKVSKAPGFRIGNVHVMAGVPAIMQAMMDAVAPTLQTGKKMLSETDAANMPESRIAERLAAIQDAHPETLIGSYPKATDGKFTTQIVIRSRDETILAAAAQDVARAVDDLSG